MTRAKRTDGPHAPIRDHLRKRKAELGIQDVVDTHGLGEGFPDLLIPLDNGLVVMLFEVKGERIIPTDMHDEIRFIMRQASPNYRIIRSVDQAEQAIVEMQANLLQQAIAFHQALSKPNLPDSLPEKQAAVRADPQNTDPRWMYVHELQALLRQFKPDDWVEVNIARNLNIGRGDNNQYATINLLHNEVKIWSDDDTQT